jgi:hypothetical protein
MTTFSTTMPLHISTSVRLAQALTTIAKVNSLSVSLKTIYKFEDGPYIRNKYNPNKAQLPILLHLYELRSLKRNELQVVKEERTTTKTTLPLQYLKNNMPSTASNINRRAPSYLFLITASSNSFFPCHFSPPSTYWNFSLSANNFTVCLRFELYSQILCDSITYSDAVDPEEAPSIFK